MSVAVIYSFELSGWLEPRLSVSQQNSELKGEI
jgi:hypothetical protein